jgi:hypothetical protein
MADRYQDRAYGAGHGRGGDQYGSDRGESDPLAELARLIGQADPVKASGQASQRPVPPRQDLRQQDLRQQDFRQQDPRQQDPRQYDPRQEIRQDYYQEEDYEPEPEPPPAPAGPPSWIQRANIRRETTPREAPREALRETLRQTPRESSRDVAREFPRALPPEPESEDYPSAVHPLHRYAAQPQVPPQSDGYYNQQSAYQQQSRQRDAYQHDPQAYAEAEPEVDPSRYDDALYGELQNSVQDFQREPAYPDDPYAYQGEYDEEQEEPRKRRGLPLKVLAVLALGVFGVTAAYGYHTYFGTTRSGEIPIIRADNSPTKIVPVTSDAGSKMPDRLTPGDGTEQIVPREEQPVDVNSQNVGPRVVFPPLNQNGNPPSVASVAPTTMPAAGAGAPPVANSATLLNSEPRKIRTLSVKGDQPDPSAVPVTAPPPAGAPTAAPAKNAKGTRTPPSNAIASANAPLSLAPQGQPEAPAAGTQVASTNPTQIEPSSAASGSYLVPITSQSSEAEARASFRAMQSKYPSVLGEQAPVITRANSKSGSVMYRGSVGPFASSAEASQFCHKYSAAGGQCWVFKN